MDISWVNKETRKAAEMHSADRGHTSIQQSCSLQRGSNSSLGVCLNNQWMKANWRSFLNSSTENCFLGWYRFPSTLPPFQFQKEVNYFLIWMNRKYYRSSFIWAKINTWKKKIIISRLAWSWSAVQLRYILLFDCARPVNIYWPGLCVSVYWFSHNFHLYILFSISVITGDWSQTALNQSPFTILIRISYTENAAYLCRI